MKIYIPCLLLLLLLSLVCGPPAVAQVERPAYTANNTIIVALEGVNQRYEFISKQLLVRHNKETHALECVLPIASLVPLSVTTPPTMAYDVLFGAKYPELLISISSPDQQAGSGRYTPAAMAGPTQRTTSIRLQGVSNETVIPIAILSDNNTYYFSTNFDVMLNNFQASMPVKYLPLLTGRVLFSIDKAYYHNLGQ